MTPSHICQVLNELAAPLHMTDADAAVCFRANSLSDTVRAATTRFQASLSGVVPDGWLKTDQYVQLVCKGVTAQGPNAMRYASAMFANGQGLPRDVGKAKHLARTALKLLVDKTKKRDLTQQQKEIIAISQQKTQDLINELDKRREPEWQGAVEQICPKVDDIRAAARARAILPTTILRAAAPQSGNEDGGLGSIELPSTAAQDPNPEKPQE